ncbi:MAG: hypothetical protein U9P12_08475, partial [Verrucomicrobiota bacterium]|nr:hypothetical protein [Verrucomicrobiota bacterium]
MKWKRILLLFLAMGHFSAYAVEPWRLGFNETNTTDTLTFIGGARIVELSDRDRQGVLLLEGIADRLDVAPNTPGFGLQDNDFTLSLMFRHDPLPATGEGSDESMVLFDSDSATITLRRGNDGGNAGTVYASLLTNQGSVLFKPSVRVDDGQWHTLTLRGDTANGLVQVFLDGVL